TKSEQRDRAARALFCATELVEANKFESEFGRAIQTAKFGEYSVRYQARFLAQVHRLAKSLSRAYVLGPQRGDLTKSFANLKEHRDPDLPDAWGTEVHIEPTPWFRDHRHYMVRSAGADHRLNSGDDLIAYLEVRTSRV